MPLLTSSPRLASARRRLRRAVLTHRRLIAALAAASAAAIALQAAAAPASPTTPVLTAAHDLPAGTVLTRDDLRRVGFAPGTVPAGMLDAVQAVGRTTVGPVREGEPITDARLLAAGLLDRLPGLVAVPVRIGDPGAVDLLRVGDRVDVLAADPQGRSPAQVVATGALVLAIPRTSNDPVPGPLSGALVVLAVPDQTGRDLAAVGVSSFLSVLLRA